MRTMKKIASLSMLALLSLTFYQCDEKENATVPIEVPETVTDFEGNTYATVKIGDQLWMAENLRTTHSSTGAELVSFPAGNNEANVAEFGRLYNYPDATAATPAGWHLPTQADFKKLIDFLGGADVAGAKLKDISFSNVPAAANAGTNESGFSAKGAGQKLSTGPPESQISGVGGFTYFWGQPPSTNTGDASAYGLRRNEIRVEETAFDKELLWFSVRYIKD